MNKNLLLGSVFGACVGLTGCADLLTRAVTGGPQQANLQFKPTSDSVAGASGVLTTAIPALKETQVNKQDNITEVGKKMVETMGEVQLKRPLTPAECKLYAYLGDRFAKEIRLADGTSEAIKDLGLTAPDFMHMSSQEAFWAGMGYQTYALGRTATAFGAQPQVHEFMEKGLEVGWQWTKKTIGTIAGGATGGVGLGSLLALFISRAVRRSRLLKASGKEMETIKKDESITGGELRSRLAKAHSRVSANASKEFGLPPPGSTYA